MKLHVVAQFVMFPSEVLSFPMPVLPAVLTVKVRFGENVAPTLTADVPTVKLQAPVPEQAPVQPAKVDEEGVSFRVTVVPLAMLAVQVPVLDVQALIAPLVLDTEPLPLTVTVTGNWATLKVAVTDCAELMVTTQEPVPEQPPLQPAKVDAAADGVAVRVTEAPLT